MIRLGLSIAAIAAALAVSSTASAAPVQWTGAGSNGHYYEAFTNTPLSFDGATAVANGSTYLGQQGYLVTITSQAEQGFVSSLISAGYWINGSDRVDEGVWRWLAGPEQDQIFWNGGPGGSAPPGAYANWAGNEPNNSGDEDYIWGNWSGPTWNDISSANLFYVVEYGGLSQPSGVPEPASWAMMIAGVGMIGAAMRRRVRKVALAV